MAFFHLPLVEQKWKTTAASRKTKKIKTRQITMNIKHNQCSSQKAKSLDTNFHPPPLILVSNIEMNTHPWFGRGSLEWGGEIQKLVLVPHLLYTTLIQISLLFPSTLFPAGWCKKFMNSAESITLCSKLTRK